MLQRQMVRELFESIEFSTAPVASIDDGGKDTFVVKRNGDDGDVDNLVLHGPHLLV
ncbi:MAG: hypothetical protein QW304_07830 [Thermoproteota archaeon]